MVCGSPSSAYKSILLNDSYNSFYSVFSKIHKASDFCPMPMPAETGPHTSLELSGSVRSLQPMLTGVALNPPKVYSNVTAIWRKERIPTVFHWPQFFLWTEGWQKKLKRLPNIVFALFSRKAKTDKKWILAFWVKYMNTFVRSCEKILVETMEYHRVHLGYYAYCSVIFMKPIQTSFRNLKNKCGDFFPYFYFWASASSVTQLLKSV